MTAVAITETLSGLLIFLVSLPLIYRKIPMNHLYGIRIPAAFKSDQSWYDINAYGGRQLAAGSVLIFLAGLAGFLISEKYTNFYLQASLVVSLIAISVPLLRILIWSRKLK